MSRFFLALRCFFAVLFTYKLPTDAAALLPREPARLPEPPAMAKEPPAMAKEPPAMVENPPDMGQSPSADVPAGASRDALRQRGALQMLALLQREGRLIDFLMEDVDSYGDAQIGAAARDIHRGCKKGLLAHVKVAAVRPEPDEAAVRIEEGYDPSAVRLIGNVTGRPPFHGTLRHHGWRAQELLLPDQPGSQDPQVITPAEVELG